MLRSYVSLSLPSMRALTQISSDLVGCLEGGPLLQHKGGDSGQGCLMIHKYVVAPIIACQIFCEVIRVKDDAIQPEGSSMRDVANIVDW